MTRARRRLALAVLLAAGPVPLLAQAGATAPPQPTSYEITVVTSDTGAHLLGEVQTGWRLRSVEPVEMRLDSAFRVIRGG